MLAPIANKAAELGPQTFPWWKDWRGKYCAIIASGPSTKREDVAKLKGNLPVIAIKENAYELAPWADVAYGCDLHWWKHRRGLPDFKGLKIGFDPKIPQFCPDVVTIRIKETRHKPSRVWSDDLLLDEPGVIGAGGNSGFQAWNLALQFGVIGTLLVGFDMQGRSGAHWYGRNNWFGGNNPDEMNFRRWRTAFANAVPIIQRIGVDVVNASSISELKCFRHQSVDRTLAQWGLT